MDLSIVILNYKTRGFLKQCIRGLEKSRLPKASEIIVVDNASGDGTPEMMREDFPHHTFIASPRNGGHAAGVNLGIAESRGKLIVSLNTDIAVFDDSIERLLAFMDQRPNVGLAGPRLMNPDGSVQLSCFRFPSLFTPVLRRTPLGKLGWAKRQLRNFLMTDFDHRSSRPVDWVLGASMIVRRSALERVGTFDERFFLYFEDVDWCRRFWQAGYEVWYAADAEMVHYHKRESAENPGLKGMFSYPTRRHIESWLKYLRKYAGVPLPERRSYVAPSPAS